MPRRISTRRGTSRACHRRNSTQEASAIQARATGRPHDWAEQRQHQQMGQSDHLSTEVRHPQPDELCTGTTKTQRQQE